jgi:hypothetical protein
VVPVELVALAGLPTVALVVKVVRFALLTWLQGSLETSQHLVVLVVPVVSAVPMMVVLVVLVVQTS